jgi:parallel beta-helix repeat protein
MNRGVLPPLLLAIGSSLAAPAMAATLCVNPAAGPPCYATIQAAVTAAADGDLILISPHPGPKGYHETVTIATPNLTLRGDTAVVPSASVVAQQCPPVYLDGCETSSNPDGCGTPHIEVTASGVRFEKLTVRNGRIEFRDGADQGTVNQVCIINGKSPGIRIGGTPVPNQCTVTRSVFQGGNGDSVYAGGGNGHVVSDNQFLMTDGSAAVISFSESLRATISNNTIRNANDGNGIQYISGPTTVLADGAVISGNVIIGSDYNGIYYRGKFPTITNNVIEGQGDDGIYVNDAFGPGGLVAHNRVIGSSEDDEGIYVNGDGIVIEHNFIALVSRRGIDVAGTGNIVRYNEIYRNARGSSADACIRCGGTGTTVLENQVHLCGGLGIYVVGTTATVQGNQVSDCGSTGIYVSEFGGHTVSGNTVTNNHGEGLGFGDAVTGATFTNNTLTGNRIDLCKDAGASGVVDGGSNTLTTGDLATPCVFP